MGELDKASFGDRGTSNMVSARRLTPSVCVVEHLSGILINIVSKSQAQPRAYLAVRH